MDINIIASVIFFIGCILFFGAVVFFFSTWITREKVKKQRQRLHTWEEELDEWATTQHDNIVTLQEENTGLQQTLAETQEKVQTHALATQGFAAKIEVLEEKLTQTTDDRDKIKSDFTKFVDFLVDAGILRTPTNGLEVSSEDLQEFYLHSNKPLKLPDISGLSAAQVRDALKHAAKRTFSNQSGSSRPFTKSYMVMQGPLNVGQLEQLKTTLMDHGYLEAHGTKRISYKLTENGKMLLQAALDGTLPD